MIDIHSHILPNIDDGSESMDESISILKNAYENGVTDLVVTPHFILGSIYNLENTGKKEALAKLQERVAEEKIPIHLYLGNEVFVENNLLELLEQDKITTINESKYLLFELPMHNVYSGVDSLIFHLRSKGYYPILAHPERYEIIKKDPTLIEDLLNKGALFQCNIGSFFGRYGKEAQKLVLLLLKHHAIHFISSDTHHLRDPYYQQIGELKKLLKEFISEEEIENLLVHNAQCVLENKTLKVEKYLPMKKTLFGNWK